MDALAQQFFSFVHTPWVFVCLFVHSFLESSFLPGAHDFFLVAVDVVAPAKSFLFAGASAAGSVCGGSFAYAIGRFGGRPVLVKLFGEKRVIVVESYFQRFGIWAVAVAGFTPLPYKLFSIVAGICELPFFPFFVVSLITRALRFYLVSTILYIFGPQIKGYLIHYFNIFSLVCFGVIIIIVVLMKRIKKKGKDTAACTVEKQ